MKKNIKYLLIFILIFGIIMPYIHVNAEDTKFENGDLRCKPDDKKSGACKEYTENGKVVKVEITTKEQDGITITKTVTKDTYNLGNYDVSFKINGKTSQNIAGDAYIVVLFDTSASFATKVSTAIEKVIDFSKKFESKENYHFALVQFASNLSNKVNTASCGGFKTEPFEKNCFCHYKECGMSYSSEIYVGLNKAYNLLSSNKISENDNKYIVLIGDGEYVFNDWTKNSFQGIHGSLNKIKNLTYYGIQYNSTTDYNSSRRVKHRSSFAKQLCGSNISNREKCNTMVMKYLLNGAEPYYKPNPSDWNEIFDNIYNDIQNKEKQHIYSGKLTDNIGKDFDYYVDGKNKSTWIKEFKDISVDNSGTFTISINKNFTSGQEWHDTNDGFKFKYDDKTISSSINPEVYWVNNTEYKSCTDTNVNVNIDTNNKLGTINFKDQSKSYLKYTCEENLKSQLYIDNNKDGVKKIYKGERLGVYIKLNLATTVTCTYNFDKEQFDKDKDEYKEELQKATTDKEKNSIQVILDQFDNVEKQYNDLINHDRNEFSDYKTRFINQNATLSLKYNDETETIPNAFINDGNIVEKNKSCNASNTKCTTTFEKTMILKQECLDGKTGVTTTCNIDSHDMVDGGNKHYLKPNKSSANISVKLTNLGINKSADINMKDEKDPACNITIIKSSIIYRQIELSDPFIQKQTNKKRTIGKNWSNNTYNFVDIIDKDIWSKEYELQYDMSKLNVEEIRKNTSNLGVNSYLGTNCSFKNNQWYCPFIRPDSNESSLYFTAVR